MNKLTKKFFSGRSEVVAKKLLGKLLVHKSPEGLTSGRIVEVESYHEDDPAAHSFGGKTKRNAALFGPPGTVYVYLIYGLHYCINTSTYKDGIGEGVLIRALEPLAGIELMKQRRGLNEIRSLCNGPAKLTQAMGINIGHGGCDLTNGSLYIASDQFSAGISEDNIVAAKRVGISKAQDELLRFYLKENPYISKK